MSGIGRLVESKYPVEGRDGRIIYSRAVRRKTLSPAASSEDLLTESYAMIGPGIAQSRGNILEFTLVR